MAQILGDKRRTSFDDNLANYVNELCDKGELDVESKKGISSQEPEIVASESVNFDDVEVDLDDQNRVFFDPAKGGHSINGLKFKDYSGALNFCGVYNKYTGKIEGGLGQSISLTLFHDPQFKLMDLSEILEHRKAYNCAIVDIKTGKYPLDIDRSAIVSVWDVAGHKRIYSIDPDRGFNEPRSKLSKIYNYLSCKF